MMYDARGQLEKLIIKLAKDIEENKENKTDQTKEVKVLAELTSAAAELTAALK